jgi:hypothetical protein
MSSIKHSKWLALIGFCTALVFGTLVLQLANIHQSPDTRQAGSTPTFTPTATPIFPWYDQLPTNKRTYEQNEEQNRIDAVKRLTATPRPTFDRMVVPTIDPNRTPISPFTRTVAGSGTIVDTQLAPFSQAMFRVENIWHTTISDTIIIVYAGGLHSDSLGKTLPTPWQGMVRVEVRTPGTPITTTDYATPLKNGAVHIVDAQGTRLALLSEGGQAFYFDVSTRQYVPSLSDPTPTPTAPFPSTPLLDPFNRPNGSVGDAASAVSGPHDGWFWNSANSLAVSNNQLTGGSGVNNEIFWNASYGSAQEAYVKLVTIPANAETIALLLKGQRNNYDQGIVEIAYRPVLGRVEVTTFETTVNGTLRGVITATLQANDIFGARAKADGTVEVFRNGNLLGTINISAWPYNAYGGHVGLWLINATGTVLDDFGGGNQNTSPLPTTGFPRTAVLDNFARLNGSLGGAWSGGTGQFTIANQKMSVSSGNSIYWNTTFSTTQEAYITLSTIDANASEIDLLLKVQGSGWNSGLIEVWYGPSDHIVQVWTYSPAQNWVQRSSNIPVTFQAGDVFGARAKADGTVEVYRNGTLLGTGNVSAWTYNANKGRIGLWMIGATMTLDDFGGGSVP